MQLHMLWAFVGLLVAISTAQRDNPTLHYDGRVYELFKTGTYWYKASLKAQGLRHSNLPGHLATFETRKEYEDVTGWILDKVFSSNLPATTHFISIGGTDIGHRNNRTFYWTTGPRAGQPISWNDTTQASLPFHVGEPNDASVDVNFEEGEPCLVLAVGDGRQFGLNDVHCFEGSLGANRQTSWYLVEYEHAIGAIQWDPWFNGHYYSMTNDTSDPRKEARLYKHRQGLSDGLVVSSRDEHALAVSMALFVNDNVFLGAQGSDPLTSMGHSTSTTPAPLHQEWKWFNVDGRPVGTNLMFWNRGPINSAVNKTALNGWYQGFIDSGKEDSQSVQPDDYEGLESCLHIKRSFVGDNEYGFNDSPCRPGYMAIETRDACAPGSVRTQGSGPCLPVDICQTYPTVCAHEPNSTCQQDPWLQYRCACKPGFARDDNNRGTCKQLPDLCIDLPCKAPEVCSTISWTNYSCSCPAPPAARLENGVCTSCTAPCPPQQYKVGTCTCVLCSTCAPGLNATTECSDSSNTVCEDLYAPVLTLMGPVNAKLEAHLSRWIEQGYQAIDNYDKDVTNMVEDETTLINDGAAMLNLSNILRLQGRRVLGNYPTSRQQLGWPNNTISAQAPPGTKWRINYIVADAAGNRANASRVIEVVDTTPPRLKLKLSAAEMQFLVIDFKPQCNMSRDNASLPCYLRVPGSENKTIISTASDLPLIVGDEVTRNWDGLLAVRVQAGDRREDDFNASDPVGSSQVAEFIASDLAGNHVDLNVELSVADVWLPRLILKGALTMSIDQNTLFTDPGYDASDPRDGNLSHRVTVFGGVNTRVPGVYVLHYRVADSSNNTVDALRTVTVLAIATTTTLPSPASSASKEVNLSLIAGCIGGVLLLVLCLLLLARYRSGGKKRLPRTPDPLEPMFVNPTYHENPADTEYLEPTVMPPNEYLEPTVMPPNEYMVPVSDSTTANVSDTDYLEPVAGTAPTYVVPPRTDGTSQLSDFNSMPDPTYSVFRAAADEPEYGIPRNTEVGAPSSLNLNEAVAIARQQSQFQDGRMHGYHGAISRDEAEERLSEQPTGSYLLRELTKSGEGTVISVKRTRGCRHYRITFNTDIQQWHLSGGHDLAGKDQLPTVVEAVAHVKSNSEKLMGLSLADDPLPADLSEL
eukprot:m.190379 g.190379  ORF g.190379 m.190379 type:complete len:1147 (+) comp16940_c0_seq1:77-3517(+)